MVSGSISVRFEQTKSTTNISMTNLSDDVTLLHLTDRIQYRLVGQDANGYPSAEKTQLGLEDGYVWLMKNSGYAVDAL
jgi:hypothetical protein